MYKQIQKVPAGNFLVPLLLSMVLYTIWPNMTRIGGVTEALFSGDYQSFIVGALCLFSGTGIDLKSVGRIVKRQGVLLIVKFIMAVTLGLLFLNYFGFDGIWGISGLAFVVIIASINPAVYLSIVSEYGDLDDQGAYGITGMFSIAFVPMLIFGLFISGSAGDMDWMPIISVLIPLGIGVALGNIDIEFRKLFVPGVGATLPLLGWNIGQSANFFDALKSGLPGILMTVVFLISCLVLLLVDRSILKQDGIIALSLFNVAGLSVSTPNLLAELHPVLAPYAVSATAQVLTACVITSILSPLLVGAQYNRLYK